MSDGSRQELSSRSSRAVLFRQFFARSLCKFSSIDARKRTAGRCSAQAANAAPGDHPVAVTRRCPALVGDGVSGQSAFRSSATLRAKQELERHELTRSENRSTLAALVARPRDNDHHARVEHEPKARAARTRARSFGSPWRKNHVIPLA